MRGHQSTWSITFTQDIYEGYTMVNVELSEIELTLIISALNTKWFSHNTGIFAATPETNARMATVYRRIIKKMEAVKYDTSRQTND